VPLFDSVNCFFRQLRLTLREWIVEQSDKLRGVAKRSGLEEILKRPAAGQVNADTTSCFANPCTDLEQLSAQGFDLRGAQRRWQLPAK
jgi:hypothetical protein